MLRAAALLLAAAVAGCATPVAPTGGPADTTPPAYVASLPAQGATRVTGREVRITFSERLDAATAARAVTVTPVGATPPRVRVSGRELVVDLPPLRDSTTYVVTVGTGLADARQVRLGAPVTVAFATGDRIDAGRIDGLVREPTEGRPAAGLAVWAYALAPDLADPAPRGTTAALPDPRAALPDYRTETDAQGRFRLDFLRPARYFVAAVADRNRNARADDGEASAVPPRPAVRADSADAPRLDLWLARVDTTAPTVRTVRGLSDRRLSVRFSESVVLRAEAGGWTVEDSASGATVPLRPSQPGPTEVVLIAPRALAATPHRVRLEAPDAVADSAGNALDPFVRSVTPAARADTVVARLAGFEPAARADSVATLAPGAWPGVRYSAPPDSVRARLVDAEGAVLPTRTETADGLTVRLVPLDTLALADGRPVRLEVTVGDSTVVQRVRRPAPSETGGLVGTVPGAPGRVVVEVTPADGPPRTTTADDDGRFAFTSLRPGPVRLRLWADRDGDGRWTPGRLAPYAPPEPLLLLTDPLTIRARWDTDVEPERLTFPAE